MPTAEPKEGARVVRRRLRVTGRVQGVWFRESCQVVAEGPPHEVEALVAWCRSGPPAAEVAGVEVAEERPEGLVGFRVG